MLIISVLSNTSRIAHHSFPALVRDAELLSLSLFIPLNLSVSFISDCLILTCLYLVLRFMSGDPITYRYTCDGPKWILISLSFLNIHPFFFILFINISKCISRVESLKHIYVDSDAFSGVSSVYYAAHSVLTLFLLCFSHGLSVFSLPLPI